jgi:hypothetical protein
MCGAFQPKNLIKELERAEHVLDDILRQISRIYNDLEPVESNLRVNNVSLNGIIVPGSLAGLVCALTANLKGDPIFNVLESLKGKGLKLPTIIKGSDRSEAQETCEYIMKIIDAKFNLKKTRLIVNLRWSSLPPIIDRDNVIIVGTRFFHGNVREISKFTNRLKELNLEVLEDNGEFGGGLLTYKLIELAKNVDSIIVLELTLSSALSENIRKVSEVLEAVAIP